MGILRILLAVSVVVAHAGPVLGIKLLSGTLAVQAFYIISGFYIALVLGRNYSLDRAGILRFYKSRFLRLAPGYWVVLGLSILTAYKVGETFYLPINDYLQKLSALNPLSKAWIFFANAFIVGQDTFPFLQVQLPSGALKLQSPFINDLNSYSANQLLLVPQAWSLGVELWFYLTAPILVRLRTPALIGALGLSIVLRLMLSISGYSADPWSYRFFPNELSLFASGMLMNRAYFWLKGSVYLKTGKFWLIALPATFSLFPYLDDTRGIVSILVLIAIAVSLPPIFEMTRSSKLDRKIGDLSYPLYLCHLLVIQIFAHFLPQALKGNFFGMSVLFGASLMSVLMYRYIDLPMDRLRHRSTASEEKTSPQYACF